MGDLGEYLIHAVAVGIGATAVMDFWAVAQKRFLGIQPLDMALVGRWIAYLPQGRFLHNPIAASEIIRGERLIGWAAHYLIGIAFAGILLSIWGEAWVRRPTLVPSLIVGLASVTAPFLLMQPAMGMGVAASKSSRPAISRLRSLATHTIFGLGLYLSGLLLGFLGT